MSCYVANKPLTYLLTYLLLSYVSAIVTFFLHCYPDIIAYC